MTDPMTAVPPANSEPPPRVRVAGLVKDFLLEGGGVRHALNDVSFHIGPADRLSVMGPSGCGKTTLLRIIAGLERPTAGRIEIDGRDATDWTPHDRSVAMVFQPPVLYPHLNVADNLAFPLRAAGVSRADRRGQIESMATDLQLTEFLPRFPEQLSGGQQQRVALARALIRRPRLLLLDEPLAHLDTRARDELLEYLLASQQSWPVPWIYVTHDRSEAIRAGNQLAIMLDGKFLQVGPPREVYEHPQCLSVAELTGAHEPNRLAHVWIDSHGHVSWRGLPLGETERSAEHAVGIVRAEAIELAESSAAVEPPSIEARVVRVEHFGSHQRLQLDDGQSRLTTIQLPAREFLIGQACRLRFVRRGVHLFDAKTEQRIALRERPG